MLQTAELKKGKLDELQWPILKLAKTKAELATTTANSILYHSNICNFKNLAGEITIKRISNLHTRLNSAGPEAETAEIQFLQGLSLGRMLKLVKSASSKGRKPVWFEHLESLLLQDPVTREIKNDLYINANLKGLAIPNLQSLSANKRIKDWVITKEIDSKHTLGHIVKKSANSVLIEHWKELDHVVSGQSKLEKCDKCALSIDPAQDSCTLRLSKNKILGALPKSALESSSKTTKIKTNLWQSVQNQQQ
ncbi:15783_t:CDS:2, partial [Gigaspora rosea]